MIIRRGNEESNNLLSEGNQKILISSRFHYYEPSTTSLKVPVVVFEDTSNIEFEKIKACVVSINKKVLFLMADNYNYYIIQVNDSFIKLVSSFKQIIIADKTIYTGKENSNNGVQIPLYINE